MQNILIICIEYGKSSSYEFTADNALSCIKKLEHGIDTLKNIKNETLIIWGDPG